MTTVPGFSSRNTDTTFPQFPARDEATVSDIAGMETPGWSNNQSVGGGATAEATAEPEPEAEPPDTDAKVVDSAVAEDKAIAKKKPAQKTSATKRG